MHDKHTLDDWLNWQETGFGMMAAGPKVMVKGKYVHEHMYMYALDPEIDAEGH